MLDLEKITLKVREIALRAGAFLRKERSGFDRSKVEKKNAHDYVSYVDKESERRIVAQLRELLPEAGFIAEEGSGSLTTENYCWLVDPLDGTTNFIHNNAPYCVSIALRSKDELQVGVVYEVCRDELFWTYKGAPSYLNNKEMQDLYSIELARRGYVVLALDLHSHGDSESLSIAELYDGAVGVDGAVQLIASLPYVDTARIGVTGHSSGGTAANLAVEIDNSRETPLIAAVLQQAGDWQDDTGGDHSGDYGSRSVGIIASTHDDFYFGTYDDAGNMLTNPAAFMDTDGAKKFLNFNEDGFAGIAEGGK